MANSVFLKVSDLRSCIQELRRDGIEYIQLSISDSDTDFDGDFSPACLEISGCKFNEPNFWFNYEELYSVENSKELEDLFLSSPHASNNLL